MKFYYRIKTGGNSFQKGPPTKGLLAEKTRFHFVLQRTIKGDPGESKFRDMEMTPAGNQPEKFLKVALEKGH